MRTVPNRGDLAGSLASTFPLLDVETASDILLIGRKNVVFEDAFLESVHDSAVVVVVLVVVDKAFFVLGVVIGVELHFEVVVDVF